MFSSNNYAETPPVESLAPYRISQQQIPSIFHRAVKKLHGDATRLGWRAVRVWQVADHAADARLILLYVAADGASIVRAQFLSREVEVESLLAIVSPMQDDSWCVTTNSDEEQFPTDNVRVSQFIGANVHSSEYLERSS